MGNVDKLNKSMEYLISTLLDITTEINNATNYDKIDINLSTVDKLTTNIKRMVDSGVSLSGELIEQPLEGNKVEEGEIEWT